MTVIANATHSVIPQKANMISRFKQYSVAHPILTILSVIVILTVLRILYGVFDWAVLRGVINSPDSQLFRVIAGFTLYVSCYQAEILRGGILSLPAGQQEAAKALGLSYWHSVSRIILPQAFKVSLPSTINQIVIIFLETPLIVIIGFFEVLASGGLRSGLLNGALPPKKFTSLSAQFSSSFHLAFPDTVPTLRRV